MTIGSTMFCRMFGTAQPERFGTPMDVRRNLLDTFKQETVKMANALLKIPASYIGSNVGISIPLPGTSTLSSGVCTDRSGNVYVADANKHVIYKVDLAGIKTILAGSAGVSGSTNGANLSARFNSPRGLACDSSGNLYVADTGNGKIRVIDIGQKTSTLAGGFSNLTDVAVAPNGDVLAVDEDANAIYRVESGGRKFLVAGGVSGDVSGIVAGVKIKGSAARFSAPQGVAVANDGRIYVTDTGNHKIKVIETDGWVTTLTGGVSGDVDGYPSRLTNPSDIAITPKGNRLFILDKITGHHKVKTVTMNGKVKSVIEIASDDVIAIALDVNETLYCVTANEAGVISGEESSSSQSGSSSSSESSGSSGSSGSSESSDLSESSGSSESSSSSESSGSSST